MISLAETQSRVSRDDIVLTAGEPKKHWRSIRKNRKWHHGNTRALLFFSFREQKTRFVLLSGMVDSIDTISNSFPTETYYFQRYLV